MRKVSRDAVVAEALALLDEVGLDAVSTRRLAARLGIEQPSLYWHFRRKEDLLTAMAEAAMAPHAEAPLPRPGDDWCAWFVGNARGLRRTLLMRRDGARLHAGSRPGTGQFGRIERKLAFLEAAGLPRRAAGMALLAVGRFTVGSVLEEQADAGSPGRSDDGDGAPRIDHEAAFEEGLALLVAGLTSMQGHSAAIHEERPRGQCRPIAVNSEAVSER